MINNVKKSEENKQTKKNIKQNGLSKKSLSLH